MNQSKFKNVNNMQFRIIKLLKKDVIALITSSS